MIEKLFERVNGLKLWEFYFVKKINIFWNGKKFVFRIFSMISEINFYSLINSENINLKKSLLFPINERRIERSMKEELKDQWMIN